MWQKSRLDKNCVLAVSTTNHCHLLDFGMFDSILFNVKQLSNKIICPQALKNIQTENWTAGAVQNYKRVCVWKLFNLNLRQIRSESIGKWCRNKQACARYFIYIYFLKCILKQNIIQVDVSFPNMSRLKHWFQKVLKFL